VLGFGEAPAHPHNRARGTFVDVGGVVQPAPAPRFSRTPCDPPSPAARPGEHTDQALTDWGIPPDQVTRLRATGAIE
jgi:alpha-methylacyl-CoA racemase